MTPAFIVRYGAPAVILVSLQAGPAAAEAPRCIEPDGAAGRSSAVIVDGGALAHTAQMSPLEDSGAITEDAAAQMQRVLDRLDAALAKAGSGIDRAVKLNVYVTRHEAVSDVQRVLAKRYAGDHKPAVSFVVTPLPEEGALVAADAVAPSTLEAGRSVQHLAGVAVLPPGSRIYVSGQAERSESLAEATRKTLESLRATLAFLDRSDADVVQLKAFLSPMSERAVVEREAAAFFDGHPIPPLVLVEWRSNVDVPIEIELIAWGGARRAGEAVEYLTPPGMTASPVFSRVARVHHPQTIYVSGLYADAAPAPAPAPSGEREVQEVFASLDRILKQAGSDFRHLAKGTYYVSTDAASAQLNALRPRYYDPQRPPAASKAVVAGVGRARLGLTLDMIAVPAGERGM